MDFLLVTIGSHGDVHPFVGLGQRLRRRGHDVAVATSGYFAPLVEAAGLRAIAMGDADEYKSIAANPDLFHPQRGFPAIMGYVTGSLRRVYEIVAANVTPGRTVLGFSSLALGARLVQEKLGLPGATIHLSPALFRSVYEMPKIPGMPLPGWLPRWMKARIYAEGNKRVIGPAINGPLNAFRRELGLPEREEFLGTWWHAPERVIGLFPEFYAAPQPDWPEQVRLAGFPLYDEADVTPMPAAVGKFLAAGDPPIAFTPGSAMWNGGPFFATAVAACRKLGRRGILLSRHLDHIPDPLPESVIHCDYAPFGELLPRCAALVHHGGIGTTAQALRAGVPQLIMPLSHDQPDNAWRLKRLGVADAVSPRSFRPSKVARRLKRLLASEQVRTDCREAAAKFEGMDGLGTAAEMLESLHPSIRPRESAAA